MTTPTLTEDLTAITAKLRGRRDEDGDSLAPVVRLLTAATQKAEALEAEQPHDLAGAEHPMYPTTDRVTRWERRNGELGERPRNGLSRWHTGDGWAAITVLQPDHPLGRRIICDNATATRIDRADGAVVFIGTAPATTRTRTSIYTYDATGAVIDCSGSKTRVAAPVELRRPR